MLRSLSSWFLVMAVLSTTTIVADSPVRTKRDPLLSVRAKVKIDHPRTKGADGSLAVQIRSRTKMVIRLIDPGGHPTSSWFRAGVSTARDAGVVVLREPQSRRLGGRVWWEATFRSRGASHTETRTTIQSAVSYGPLIVESFLSGPDDQVREASREFDTIRASLELGRLSSLTANRLRRGTKADIVGMWRLVDHEETHRSACSQRGGVPLVQADTSRYRFARTGGLVPIPKVGSSVALNPGNKREDESDQQRTRFRVNQLGKLEILSQVDAREFAFFVVAANPGAVKGPHPGDIVLVSSPWGESPIEILVLRRVKEPGRTRR